MEDVLKREYKQSSEPYLLPANCILARKSRFWTPMGSGARPVSGINRRGEQKSAAQKLEKCSTWNILSSCLEQYKSVMTDKVK
jgi:hypothetical protein